MGLLLSVLEEFPGMRGKEDWSFQRWLLGGRCGCCRASTDKKDLVMRSEQREEKPETGCQRGDWNWMGGRGGPDSEVSP